MMSPEFMGLPPLKETIPINFIQAKEASYRTIDQTYQDPMEVTEAAFVGDLDYLTENNERTARKGLSSYTQSLKRGIPAASLRSRREVEVQNNKRRRQQADDDFKNHQQFLDVLEGQERDDQKRADDFKGMVDDLGAAIDDENKRAEDLDRIAEDLNNFVDAANDLEAKRAAGNPWDDLNIVDRTIFNFLHPEVSYNEVLPIRPGDPGYDIIHADEIAAAEEIKRFNEAVNDPNFMPIIGGPTTMNTNLSYTQEELAAHPEMATQDENGVWSLNSLDEIYEDLKGQQAETERNPVVNDSSIGPVIQNPVFGGPG